MLLLFLLNFVNYLIWDNIGYKYGVGSLSFGTSIPYGVFPVYSGSFQLAEGDGFYIIGPGFKYREMDFNIYDILGYGYNDSSIVVKCTDSLKNLHYLMTCETEYMLESGIPSLSFQEIPEDVYLKKKKYYKWVVLDDSYVLTITRIKAFSFLGSVVFGFLLLQYWVRKRRKQKP